MRPRRNLDVEGAIESEGDAARDRAHVIGAASFQDRRCRRVRTTAFHGRQSTRFSQPEPRACTGTLRPHTIENSHSVTTSTLSSNPWHEMFESNPSFWTLAPRVPFLLKTKRIAILTQMFALDHQLLSLIAPVSRLSIERDLNRMAQQSSNGNRSDAE